MGDGQLNVELHVKNMEGKGVGVVTKSDLSRGEYIGTYVGQRLTTTQAAQKEQQYANEKRYATYIVHVDKTEGLGGNISRNCSSAFAIDSTRMGNVTRFLNHSCDPNMVLKKVFTNGYHNQYPHLAFFAIKDIKEGDELTWKYLESGGGGKGTIKCLCGAPNSICRGTL